jgi:hypothetical protein
MTPIGTMFVLLIGVSFTVLITGLDNLAGILAFAVVIATTSMCIIAAIPFATHAISGRSLGFEIRQLNIGPLQILRADRLNLRPVESWRDVFRLQVIVPAYQLSHPRLRVLIFLLGGNVASSLVFVASIVALAHETQSPAGTLGVYCSLLAFAAGALIWLLWTVSQTLLCMIWILRGGNDMPSLLAGVEMRWQDLDRLRPRDWARDLLLRRPWPAVSGAELAGWLNAYYREMDRGNVEEAASFIDRIVARISPAPQFVPDARIVPETAYFAARFKENPTLARNWLDRSRPRSEVRHIQLRAQAAILLAERRYAEARDRATEALSWVNELPPSGLAQAEREWIQRIIGDAESGMRMTPEPDP